MDPQAVTPTGEIKVRVNKLLGNEKVSSVKLETNKLSLDEQGKIAEEFDMI